MVIRNAMEKWSNKINGHVTNVRPLTPGNIETVGLGATYKTDATVTHFAKDGNQSRQYKFIGLWPSEISPIDLDWSTTDTLEEYTVTFQYDLWVNLKVGEVGPSTDEV
jgi:hypothetical protein